MIEIIQEVNIRMLPGLGKARIAVKRAERAGLKAELEAYVIDRLGPHPRGEEVTKLLEDSDAVYRALGLTQYLVGQKIEGPTPLHIDRSPVWGRRDGLLADYGLPSAGEVFGPQLRCEPNNPPKDLQELADDRARRIVVWDESILFLAPRIIPGECKMAYDKIEGKGSLDAVFAAAFRSYYSGCAVMCGGNTVFNYLASCAEQTTAGLLFDEKGQGAGAELVAKVSQEWEKDPDQPMGPFIDRVAEEALKIPFAGRE